MEDCSLQLIDAGAFTTNRWITVQRNIERRVIIKGLLRITIGDEATDCVEVEAHGRTIRRQFRYAKQTSHARQTRLTSRPVGCAAPRTHGATVLGRHDILTTFLAAPGAGAILRLAGFTRVKNLAGGMLQWTRAGLPVQR